MGTDTEERNEAIWERRRDHSAGDQNSPGGRSCPGD